MKTHIDDIRLFNNAGISFPVCMAGAKTLNMDATGWPEAPKEEATCKRCIRAYAKRYPWTVR
jgi:hypothetical protein